MTEPTFHAERLIALAFQTNSPADTLHSLEDVLPHALLTQLSLLSLLQCRDQATGPERLLLEASLSVEQRQGAYAQICQTVRTRYLMGGQLEATTDGIWVQVHIYDATLERFIVEAQGLLSHFTEQHGQSGPDMQAFQQLLSELLSPFLQRLQPERASQLLPTLSRSYPALLLLLKAQHQESAAEKARLYERALSLDPSLEPAYANLARLYRSDEQYEQSVLFYRKALENSQAIPAIKAQYATDAGICLAVLGRHDLALQWWQRAIEYNPAYINPYFNIANVHEDQGDFAQAEAYFDKAQQLAPDDFRTYFNLARIYSKLGVWDKALVQYQYQLKTDENDPWVHSDIANVYLHLGDLEQARNHLRKTVQLDAEGEAGQFAQLILDGMGA